MIQGLLNKRQFSILERAFCAEVEAALNNTIPLLRTKSKMAYELCEAGYLEDMEWVVSEKPRVTVDGYVLTHLGRLVYCTSGPDAKQETK